MGRYFDDWEDYARGNTLRFADLYRDVGWRYSDYVRRAHIAFRREHTHRYSSDLPHVTIFWERPRMNPDTLVSTTSDGEPR